MTMWHTHYSTGMKFIYQQIRICKSSIANN